MKRSTKLWHGLGGGVLRAGALAVVGGALLPAALAVPVDEGGEGGEDGTTAGPGHSAFAGNLEKAINNIFAGEGGEGGAGLTPMWPSVTVPALSTSDIETVVTGRTLRTDGHVAWYFAPDHQIEGGYVEWKATDQQNCPAQEEATDAFYRGTDGVCYTYTLYSSKGTWSARDNQLCVDVSWSAGSKKACRYVAILLDDIALFDERGKIDGKGMKLHKGRALAE